MKHIVLVCLFSLCVMRSAWAVPITAISTDESSHAVTALSDEAQGRAWQLSEQDWQAYTQFLQTQAGYWYGELDPPEVLGLLTDDPDKREIYARLVVEQRQARIERELAFQRAIDQAWQALSPHLLPVDQSNVTALLQKKPTDALSLQAGDR